MDEGHRLTNQFNQLPRSLNQPNLQTLTRRTCGFRTQEQDELSAILINLVYKTNLNVAQIRSRPRKLES